MNPTIDKVRMRERATALASSIQEAAEDLRELRARIAPDGTGSTDEDLAELVEKIVESVTVAHSRAHELVRQVPYSPSHPFGPRMPGPLLGGS